MVNCSGQLIGVPTAGATVPSAYGGSSGGSVGLGFAIPVNLAKTIADEIISTGAGDPLLLRPAARCRSRPRRPPRPACPSGLFVQTVVPGGPAAKAGLPAGDVITEINGQPATSTVQLQELTLTKKPGDTVPLQVWRSGQTAAVHRHPGHPALAAAAGRGSPARGGPRRGDVGTALFGQPGGEAEQGGLRGEILPAIRPSP